MIFDIYCDESRQDLLVEKSSITKNNRYVCIGGIMLPTENRENLKMKIKDLKQQYEVYGELKWGNVSPNKIEFYLELIDLFFNYESIDFRTVIIDAIEVDNETFNRNDHELGYYKFYYQLLYHWIDPSKNYYVFTDYKTNKDNTRLNSLKKILNNACHSPCVAIVQPINSKESLLLQLQNVLMGAVGYKFNYRTAGESIAKQALVKRIEWHLGHEISPTPKDYKKFNIFKIDLRKEIF